MFKNWPTLLACLLFGTGGMFMFFLGCSLFAWLPLFNHIYQIGIVVIGGYLLGVGALICQFCYSTFKDNLT